MKKIHEHTKMFGEWFNNLRFSNFLLEENNFFFHSISIFNEKDTKIRKKKKKDHRWFYLITARNNAEGIKPQIYLLKYISPPRRFTAPIDSFLSREHSKTVLQEWGREGEDLMNPRKLYRLAGNKTKQLSINVTKSDNRGRFIIENVRLSLPLQRQRTI